MKKLVIPLVIIFLYMALGVYTLDEEHQVVVTTFGEPSLVSEPGLHFIFPFFQKRWKVNTTVNGIPIGYSLDSNEGIMQDSMMISSDYNFVNVDFFLEYVVSDPIKLLYNSDDYVGIIKATANNSIRTVIASYPVDAILTTGKSEIQANILSLLIEQIDDLDIGITIRSITMQDSEPPNKEVDDAFKAVETAKQNRTTKVNEANQYRNENLPKAKAEVDKILQNAEAWKSKRISEAKGQVAKFNSMYEEYIKFPDITKKRMFYEAMEEVLPNLKVIILGDDGTETILPIDSFVESKEG